MADVLTKETIARMAGDPWGSYALREGELATLCRSHEALRTRLESAEQEARIWTGPHATCRICGACADRPFGQVSVAIPHRPTCPFAALGAA